MLPGYDWHDSVDIAKIGLGTPVEYPLDPGDAICWERDFLHDSLANQSPNNRWSMVLVFVDGDELDFKAFDSVRLSTIVSPAN